MEFASGWVVSQGLANSGQLITGAVNSSTVLFIIGMLDLKAAALWIFHRR